jgi:hypothetical protein
VIHQVIEAQLVDGDVLKSGRLSESQVDQAMGLLGSGGPLRAGRMFEQTVLRVIPQHRISEIRVSVAVDVEGR